MGAAFLQEETRRGRGTLHGVRLPARFSVRRKMFPPIPQVKKEIAKALMPTAGVSDPSICTQEVGASPPGYQRLVRSREWGRGCLWRWGQSGGALSVGGGSAEGHDPPAPEAVHVGAHHESRNAGHWSRTAVRHPSPRGRACGPFPCHKSGAGPSVLVVPLLGGSLWAPATAPPPHYHTSRHRSKDPASRSSRLRVLMRQPKRSP